MHSYRVNEIFYSLQGEGYFTGKPAVFVRLSGCNRSCVFCDTDFSAYTEMSASEIADAAAQFPSRHMVITGGEPALQTDKELLDAIHYRNFFIAIETNGSLPLPENIDWITCSPKAKPWHITKVDELKIVFTGNENVEEIASQFNPAHLFLQPVYQPDGNSNTADTINYILAHPHWRLSLQTHKLTGIR